MWRHAADPVAKADESVPRLSEWMALRRGFATNIANPKVMVFFASIFTALLPPSMPLWARGAALAIVGLDEGLWYSMLAIVLSTSHAQMVYRRAKGWIDRAAGSAMMMFGGRLLWSARS